jgi:dinuclear metal center YbgI/SA1388 family protein
MTTIQQICDFLTEFAPPALAEDWDNVGLLVGDATRPAGRVITCLTVTPESAAEAVREQADLIVSHHPFPFRPLKQLTTDTTVGRLLLQLVAAGVSVHSPHTAFDSAAAGINQQLVEGLGLGDIRPLVDSPQIPDLGAGRCGQLPQSQSLDSVAERLSGFLKVRGLQVVGSRDRMVRSIAVACGSAGQLLAAARRAGCDLFITGEASFHTCLEAQAAGMAMLLPGHYASERFAVERLATILAAQFPQARVWACQSERDPLEWRDS